MSRLGSLGEWDESRVKIRANKKGSRPRTKDRPRHEDSVTGRIVTVDRGRYRAIVAEDTPEERLVIAARAKELRRQPIVPGDLVQLVGDTSGAKDTLARLVRIDERASFLRRSADDTDPVERPVVANADQLVIVVAAANPEPRTGFIDRALVAAFDAGITPVLCITKCDLKDPTELIEAYSAIDITVLATRTLDSGGDAAPHSPEANEPRGSADVEESAVEAVRRACNGKVSVLLGHSGVGKSTLVNALTGADRATGGVNAVTGRGRHTSSSALMLRVPDADPGTWIIDTPGVRSFGLAHVEPDNVVAAFEDLAPAVADCERGCTHSPTAPGCALDAWVAEGHAGPTGPARLASLRRLIQAETDEHQREKHLGHHPAPEPDLPKGTP
ncbi:ribosome small subunit-dependent GTPase A [Falsarthrobacter nasiphocae]|uniref:Small ribosomal subunit biogenesis GTPase RsgA n=1 Tax=Falsarthrobacter nasiphocae TaxID=189863 RepID=A0AAE3YIP3_9MICC|nr:ribosome small subunit-dependent GTPase A [Falsarthrobacter nasiphocae]MDR6892736.1 ribosome biogenesis GTPase [Falsarthrobacter nasiphocae]